MNRRLECYELLVDVAKAVPDLIKAIPRGESELKDQLKRAMLSSMLNLAEGNGRYSIKERNRFFNISLGSISELSATMDYATAFRYLDERNSQKLIASLRKAYNMVRKLRK